jgi:hypothetical protein
MKIELIILPSLFILISCSNSSNQRTKVLDHKTENVSLISNDKNSKTLYTDTCKCSDLGHRLEGEFYLEYHLTTNELYSGVCEVTRDNGDYLFYKYENGHILEIIEFYKSDTLKEEMYYDLKGHIYRRNRFHQNGNKSYTVIFTDHTYETFYENGKLERQGGYGFTEKDIDKYYNLEEIRLFDSIWKETGEFDSVYHYSKASITY